MLEGIILIDNLNTTEDTAQKELDNNELQRALTSEINVAKLQYQSDEKTLRDRITLMLGVVNDENTTSDDAANRIRMYMKQDDSLEDQIKFWNALKSL